MDVNQPLSVKGIEPEAREAAKLAARRAGMTLGAWLNRVIHQAAAEALTGGKPGSPAAGSPASDPPRLPALPVDALLDAIREQGEETRKALLESTGRIEEAAEKIGTLGDLPKRLTEAEQKADRAALAVGPLERTVVRLSERLNPPDEPPIERRGFLSRLFGG
jgi:localization factor PodJL